MNNVVRLQTRRRATPIVPDTSEAFNAAWLLLPESARTRSSRRLSWPEWCKVAAEIGEDDLLARVRRYAAEDKDHRRECGAPGFHRWLLWGRWEHWEAKTPRIHVVPTAVFPEPALRLSFFTRFGDQKARKWFDRCGWDGDTREVLNAPPARAEWLNGPFRKWAVANTVNGVKFL